MPEHSPELGKKLAQLTPTQELPMVIESEVVTWTPSIRRIVACVNACEGIPTEALEKLVLDRCLKEILEGIEWRGGDGYESACPWCHGGEAEYLGHESDCELAMLIEGRNHADPT